MMFDRFLIILILAMFVIDTPTIVIADSNRSIGNPLLNEELHMVAAKGNVSEVKTLLEKGADPNFMYQGKSVMHWAAGQNYPEVVICLFNYGANPNQKEDEKGWTPLHWAIFKNNSDIIKILLEHHVNVNIQDNQGRTSLHLACQTGDDSIVAKVLSSGANVMIRDEQGRYPEDIALSKGYLGIADMILKQQDKQISEDEKLLLSAADSMDSSVVKELINRGVNVNCEATFSHHTPLHSVAWNGNCEIANMLIKAGAKIDARSGADVTPLYQAAKNFQLDMVKMLIRFGADVNVQTFDGTTPLHAPVCYTDVIPIAPENEMIACDIIEELVSKGGNVNAKSKTGDTPLHEAAKAGYCKAAECLLKHGSDKSIKNSNGFTPRDLAKQRNHFELAKML